MGSKLGEAGGLKTFIKKKVGSIYDLWHTG